LEAREGLGLERELEREHLAQRRLVERREDLRVRDVRDARLGRSRARPDVERAGPRPERAERRHDVAARERTHVRAGREERRLAARREEIDARRDPAEHVGSTRPRRAVARPADAEDRLRNDERAEHAVEVHDEIHRDARRRSSGAGAPPASVPMDLIVHFDGVLSTLVVPEPVLCIRGPCDGATRPGRADMLGRVAARVDLFTSSGQTALFAAGADMGPFPSSDIVPPFGAFGPWAGSFDVRPSSRPAEPSVADVSYTQIFPALYQAPLREVFALELALETEAFTSFQSGRYLHSGALADFFHTAAADLTTSAPDVVVQRLASDGSPLAADDPDGDGLG